MPTCEFFEQFEKAGPAALLPPGVYTLQVLIDSLFFFLVLNLDFVEKMELGYVKCLICEFGS